MSDQLPLLTEAEIKALLCEPAPDGVPQGEGLHVLVVDNDAATRVLVAEILAGMGAEISQASDATGALSTIEGDPTINVLLTDLRMPGPGGADLCDAVSKVPDRRIARVVTSGGGTMADALAAFENGVRDFLPKPIDPGRLGLALVRCREALGRG